jgi:hypothetical protein
MKRQPIYCNDDENLRMVPLPGRGALWAVQRRVRGLKGSNAVNEKKLVNGKPKWTCITKHVDPWVGAKAVSFEQAAKHVGV